MAASVPKPPGPPSARLAELLSGGSPAAPLPPGLSGGGSPIPGRESPSAGKGRPGSNRLAADQPGPAGAAPGPSLPALLARSAADCVALLAASPGLRALPPPVLPPHPAHLTWRNWLFAGAGLRRGHVELFAAGDRFAVLHVCLFAEPDRRLPVFGMDLVTGRALPAGFFLDLTRAGPDQAHAARTLLAAPPAGLRGSARPRPDWGSIFSPEFLCLRPATPSAAAACLGHGTAVLSAWLSALAAGAAAPPASPAETASARHAQRAYCLAQQRNDHTLRMLTGFVGAAAAADVMAALLFPLPD